MRRRHQLIRHGSLQPVRDFPTRGGDVIPEALSHTPGPPNLLRKPPAVEMGSAIALAPVPRKPPGKATLSRQEAP